MPTSFLSRFQQGWRILLEIGFSLLCGRFLFAVIRESDWPNILFIATGIALAWWRPAASTFALVLCPGLLAGLERTLYCFPASPILMLASACWLGAALRRMLPAVSSEGDPGGKPPPFQSSADWIALLVDVLATIALFSLYAQLHQQAAAPDFWSRFWREVSYGAPDSLYPLTAAFLWLHGLFYFRALRQGGLASSMLTPGRIGLVFCANSLVLLFFFGVQWGFGLPYHWTPGFQAPFEDIGAFGAMAVCSLIVCLALLRRGSWLRVLAHILLAILLAVAVGASWSRATWLACATYVSLLALLRLPRTALLLGTMTVVGTLLLNLAAKPTYSDQPYLERLISLVRFENPRNKSSERFELYHKAWRMVRERPWTGHGIGTFFVKAPNYSRPGDPNATLSYFPHNLLFQLAAEQGLAAAGLFCWLMAMVLQRGARCWSRSSRTTPGVSGDPASPAPLALGLTLAVAAYLQANLTWDLLTVHPTQPFFFWFMIAALLTLVDRADRSSRPASD